MKKQNKVVFFNILSTILLQGLSIITAPLFSRLLGDAGYGVVAIYNVWINVLALVFTLNTRGSLMSARIEYSGEEQDAYASSALSLSIGFFLLCAGAVLLFLEPFARLVQLPKAIVLMLLAQVITGYSVSFLNTKFTYDFKAGWNCFISVLSAVLVMGLSLLFVWLLPRELDYYGRIGGMALTQVLLGLACAGYVLRRGKTLYNKTYWKFCLGLSIPLIFYNLSDLALGYTDRLMLQYMMSKAMVGQYSLAAAFATIMFTIFSALNGSWVPFFFEDYKQNARDRMRSQAKNYLEVYTVLSMGFVLLTREVYHVFASREFWFGTDFIPIFVAGYYLNFLCTFPVNVEYCHKKTKAVAVITIIAACVNLSLNYFLIRAMGPMGAVISTAASHGVQMVLHYCYARFRLGKGEYPFKLELWWKYAAAFLLAVVIFYLTPEQWWLRWGLGAALGLWELLRIKKRKALL